jgi:hypothetical protein
VVVRECDLVVIVPIIVIVVVVIIVVNDVHIFLLRVVVVGCVKIGSEFAVSGE